jgi:hypothetical protein
VHIVERQMLKKSLQNNTAFKNINTYVMSIKEFLKIILSKYYFIQVLFLSKCHFYPNVWPDFSAASPGWSEILTSTLQMRINQ